MLRMAMALLKFILDINSALKLLLLKNERITNFNSNIFMESYDTVTNALKGLKAKGYTLDFNISFDTIKCDEHNICLNPNEFEIMETYRFEGDTNPSDEDVVYAIESKDGSIKGTMTSAYGIYADTVHADMIKKLAVHQ
jgi:hypothetical protein